MSDMSDYILIIDWKNANGCDMCVRGNAEKLALMYDSFTRFLLTKDPGIILRVIAAWDNGKGAANDR